MEGERANEKEIREWLADPAASGELFPPRGCTCERCDEYHMDRRATGYHRLLTKGDKGHTFRKCVLRCGKVRNEEFDCKAAPEETRLREVSMYQPCCCGVIFDETVQAACDKCGWDANFRGLCPVDARDDTVMNVLVYGESQRGKEKTGEDGKETSFQSVPLNTDMTIGEVYAALGDASEEYLLHYYSYMIEDLTSKIHDYTFGKNTIKIAADFSAAVEHKFSGNLTCTAFNHSNCEVVVVALNPREIKGADGKSKRVVDTHVWFGIGPTTSKFKEADSHFHNAYLAHIIEYYKDNLHTFVDEDVPDGVPETTLENVIVCTDGCAGQYKGRFNFKYLAAYAKRFGVTVMQAFSATAHGKGFHDALGQKPGLLMKDAELYDGRRIEFAYDLFLLCREKLPETVPASQRGKGLHAVHKYFVNYVTSDHRDIHLGEPSVIYIDRRRKWETDGIPGSATKYFFCGADKTDDEHIWTKTYFCSCTVCRRFDFFNCRAVKWTGGLTSHTLRYTDSSSAARKRAEVLANLAAFAGGVRDGDALVFALEDQEAEDDGHPYGIAIADGPPFKADRVLKTGADGVSQKIITGEWCARIKFWLRRDAEDPLKFSPAPLTAERGRIAATIFSLKNMQLTPKVSLRLDSSNAEPVYFLSISDHDALLRKNWERFRHRL